MTNLGRPDESYHVVVHSRTGLNWAGIVGREAGLAYQRQVDDKLVNLFAHFSDPDAYWKPEQTYRGIGGKRRLYMKMGK